MNQLTRHLLVAAALAGGAFAPAVVADEPAANPKCRSVHADLVESSATVGCKPEHTSCFLGVVDGNHGLRGTTYFRGDSGATGPATSPGFRSYSGIFEYTTSRGGLVARETGVVKGQAPGDAEKGVVTAYQKITGATGEFTGVTGYFFVSGLLGGGQVVTNVTGEICYP